MPVNYASFYNDPGPSNRSGMNAIQNALQFRANQDQVQNDNAFRERSYQDQQQRLNKQDAQSSQDRQLKLLGVVAKTVGDALGSVNDEQSFQVYRGFLQKLSQTPLGQDKFFQKIVTETPQNYDPNNVEKGKKILSFIYGKSQGEGFTLGQNQVRFDSSGKEIARGPSKSGKTIERTIDLNDKVRVIYTDGTQKDLPKGSAPSKTKDLADKAMMHITKNLGMEGDLFEMNADTQRDHALYVDIVDTLTKTGRYRNPIDVANAAMKIFNSAKPQGQTDEEVRSYNESLKSGVNKALGRQQQDQPKELTREQAVQYMRKANGDKQKAMDLAKQDGYQF